MSGLHADAHRGSGWCRCGPVAVPVPQLPLHSAGTGLPHCEQAHVDEVTVSSTAAMNPASRVSAGVRVLEGPWRARAPERAVARAALRSEPTGRPPRCASQATATRVAPPTWLGTPGPDTVLGYGRGLGVRQNREGRTPSSSRSRCGPSWPWRSTVQPRLASSRASPGLSPRATATRDAVAASRAPTHVSTASAICP